MSPQSAEVQRNHSQPRDLSFCRDGVQESLKVAMSSASRIRMDKDPLLVHAELDPCDVAFHLVDIAPSTIPHSAPRSVDDQQGLHELHHIENPSVESQPGGESTVLYC